MTTTKTLVICPRCAYDKSLLYTRDEEATFRWGFLAGFAVAAAFAAAMLMVLSGVIG